MVGERGRPWLDGPLGHAQLAGELCGAQQGGLVAADVADGDLAQGRVDAFEANDLLVDLGRRYRRERFTAWVVQAPRLYDAPSKYMRRAVEQCAYRSGLGGRSSSGRRSASHHCSGKCGDAFAGLPGSLTAATPSCTNRHMPRRLNEPPGSIVVPGPIPHPDTPPSGTCQERPPSDEGAAASVAADHEPSLHGAAIDEPWRRGSDG